VPVTEQSIRDEIAKRIERMSGSSEPICRRCIEKYRSTLDGIIKDSVNNIVEMGVLFCEEEDGECEIGKMCTGEWCTVTLTDCDGKKEMGSFHTHPMGTVRPSRDDLLFALSHEHVFFAIGDYLGNISCYTLNMHSHEMQQYLGMCDEAEKIADRLVHGLQEIIVTMLRTESIDPVHVPALNVFLEGKYLTPGSTIRDVVGILQDALQDSEDIVTKTKFVELIPDMKEYGKRAGEIIQYFKDNFDRLYTEQKM